MRVALAVLLLFTTGCPMPSSKSPEELAEEHFRQAESKPQSHAAVQFAELLVAGRFEEAAAMLDPELRRTTTVEELATEFTTMIDYGDGPAVHIQPVGTLDEWPGRQEGDLGWAYVSISGPGFVEAVTVVVTKAGTIREIEWGRP